MVCILERPEPQVEFDHLKNLFQTTVMGGAEIIPESNEWYVVSNDAALLHEFRSLADQQWREQDPRYACCDNLIKLAAENGVYPKPASFSTGFVTITGVAGTAIPVGQQITFDNLVYNVTSNLPQDLSDAGSYTVKVQAETAGAAGNKQSDVTTGNLTAPVAGLDDVVTVGGGLFCGGKDSEVCEKFRVRYIERRKFSPSLNFASIKAYILDNIPCATRVFNRADCCATINPCGCPECQPALDLYVLYDNTFECGIAPVECIVELNRLLFGINNGHGEGVVDIGICGKVHDLNAAKINLDFHGTECATSNQLAEVSSMIADYFLVQGPSGKIEANAIIFEVKRILNGADNLQIDLSIAAGQSSEVGIIDTLCGDFIAECDHIPCLGTITFPDAVQTTSCF